MIKINALADIFRMSDDFNITFKKHLVEYFGELRDNLSPEEKIDNFTLEEHGSIVIFNNVDDYDNLDEVGISDIQDVNPEWIELKDGGFYQAAILCNNEYMLILYLKEDSITDSVRDWIDCNA